MEPFTRARLLRLQRPPASAPTKSPPMSANGARRGRSTPQQRTSAPSSKPPSSSILPPFQAPVPSNRKFLPQTGSSRGSRSPTKSGQLPPPLSNSPRLRLLHFLSHTLGHFSSPAIHPIARNPTFPNSRNSTRHPHCLTAEHHLPVILVVNQPLKRNREVNIADGTYELHPTPEEEAVADLHHAEVEPVLEQAEDQFANSECEGEDDVSVFAASSAWSTQLPPGWTVEWDPSSDGEDRGQ
ncbi:uncharacterized protein [Setaria viridis]